MPRRRMEDLIQTMPDTDSAESPNGSGTTEDAPALKLVDYHSQETPKKKRRSRPISEKVEGRMAQLLPSDWDYLEKSLTTVKRNNQRLHGKKGRATVNTLLRVAIKSMRQADIKWADINGLTEQELEDSLVIAIEDSRAH